MFFFQFCRMEEIQLIDTHCHLYVDAFKDDREKMLERAGEAGVSHYYLPAIDRSEHESMLALEAAHPHTCHAMMGLHPCSVKEDVELELGLVKTWLDRRSFAAVGEIGLDYYWDKTYMEAQQEAFRRQIGWALEKQLPIVIHSRSATDDCIRLVGEQQNGHLKGIFHCFSDGLKEAQQMIALGFYLGIGGVLTYKNSGLAEVVKQLPLEHLVLETDAPYLSPVPFRGKRNESSYLRYVAEQLAAIKNTSLKTVADITTANAQKIFGL